MFTRRIIAALSLAIGSAVYLAFRDDCLLMFQWFAWIGLAGPVSYLRRWASAYRSGLPDWLIFAAPNGLWLLSYWLFLSLIWRNGRWCAPVVWGLALSIVAVSTEFCQRWGLLRGTFDWKDVAAYTAASAAGVAVTFSRRTDHG